MIEGQLPEAPANRYDSFLIDLDGVVCRGTRAVPHAVTSLEALAQMSKRVVFVTNNASRTPDEVVELLHSLGAAAASSAVVTSAVAAAGRLAEELVEGDAVLVVGGHALDSALYRVGLRPVRSAENDPRAVLQGWSPDVDWNQLAEASFALARGIPWIVTNTDATVPKERGLAPGNGTLVAAVARATGRRPDIVGKPEPHLFREAIRRSGTPRGLVIGDRLDTDVAGARRTGLDSALVLTGATSADDLRLISGSEQPTYVWRDLRDLFVVRGIPSSMEPTIGVTPRRCGAPTPGWRTGRRA